MAAGAKGLLTSRRSFVWSGGSEKMRKRRGPSAMRPEIRDWLDANPRVQVHFTPTSGSWLNLVEVWFGIIERQAIHRGTFTSVRDLNAKIRTFITGWNDRCHPFAWTKTADEILKKANRQTTSNTAH